MQNRIDRIQKNEKLNKNTGFRDVTRENKQEHYPNFLQVQYHPYRILIASDSGSGKMNALLNLINI